VARILDGMTAVLGFRPQRLPGRDVLAAKPAGPPALEHTPDPTTPQKSRARGLSVILRRAGRHGAIGALMVGDRPHRPAASYRPGHPTAYMKEQA
jgi:hypothetical protein